MRLPRPQPLRVFSFQAERPLSQLQEASRSALTPLPSPWKTSAWFTQACTMHIDTCINTYYISFVKSWSSRDILKTLSADGWIVKHQVGSHVQLIHPTKPGKVTVPHPRKNLAPGTVRSIARQAGLDLEA